MDNRRQAAIEKAYSMLLETRQHMVVMVLPWKAISESIVVEYHSVLDELEGIGIDTSDFRIPETEIVQMVTSFNPIKRQKTYSKDRFVREQYFFQKYNAVLRRFTNTDAQMPGKIGFV